MPAGGFSLTNLVTFALRVKDGKLAARELEGFANTAEKEARKTSEAADQMAASYRRAGARMLASGTIILTGLAKAGQATNALAVAQASTNTVFADAAGIIDEYSSNSVEKLGLSERAYRQASSQLGSFLKGLGFDLPTAAATANRLLEVGADRAALFGRTTDEAANAISAALRKEFDTIERFGVTITQAGVNAKVLELGLDTSTEAAKRNAEAVATLELIYEQTGDSVGFFASEANKLNREAAQTKADFENLAAEIGRTALPILKETVGVVRDLVGVFAGLPEPVQSNIGRIAFLAAAFNILGGAAFTTAGNLGRLRTGLKNLTAAKVGSVVALGGALTLGVAIWDKWNRKAEEAKDRAEDAATAIANAATETEGLNNFLTRQLALGENRELLQYINDVGAEVEDIVRIFNAAEGSESKFIEGITSEFGGGAQLFTTGLDDIRNLFDALKDGKLIAEGLARTNVDDAAASHRDFQRALTGVAEAADEANDELPDFSDNVKITVAESKPLKDVLNDINSELDEFIDNLFFDSTESDYAKAVRDLATALEESEGTFSNATDEGIEAQEAWEEAAAAAARRLSQVAVDENLTDEQVRARFALMREELLGVAHDGGIARDELDELEAKLDSLEDEIIIQLELGGQGEFVRELEAWLGSLNGAPLFITPSISNPRDNGTGFRPEVNPFRPGDPRTGGFQLAPFEFADTPSSATDPSSDGRLGGISGGGITAVSTPVVLKLDSRVLATATARATIETGGEPVQVRGSR